MNDTGAIDTATRRLTAALDALEAALERRQEADQAESGRVAEMQALGADRARLAGELDHALARARGLEVSNREIARRLDNAIGTIREVLQASGS